MSGIGGTGYDIAMGTYEDAVAMIGYTTPVRFGEAPVNVAMARHFAAMVRDANAGFWDEDFARRAMGRLHRSAGHAHDVGDAHRVEAGRCAPRAAAHGPSPAPRDHVRERVERHRVLPPDSGRRSPERQRGARRRLGGETNGARHGALRHHVQHLPAPGRHDGGPHDQRALPIRVRTTHDRRRRLPPALLRGRPTRRGAPRGRGSRSRTGGSS